MADDILTLARELAEVTRLVEADDFGSTLERFVRRIVRTIPGCDAATITVRSSEAVETVAGGSDVPLDPLMPGPVVEALTFTEPRRLEDTTADQRWPGFSAKLLNAGFHGCLALPLPTDSQESAVLTLYSRAPDQFGDIGFDVVLLLTLHAGAVFDNAGLYHDSRKLVSQLQVALHTRSLIGRAQGLVMREYGHDSDQAFEALRRASQHSNTKLRDLAQLLVDAHEDGTFETAAGKLALTAAR